MKKMALTAVCSAIVALAHAHGIVTRTFEPVAVSTNAAGRVLFDFGEEWFGWAEARGEGEAELRLGELCDANGAVDMGRGGTIRSAAVKVSLDGDWRRVALIGDKRNTSGGREGKAIRLPEEFGVVMPFRYVEAPAGCEVRMKAVHWPMDEAAASFSCDSEGLMKVYGFCKHSIIATSFAGIYVDGDRERIPYESDAYINQLGEYAVHADFTLSRRSFDYLMEHPTWPTEWRQHMIKMAWTEWMWSGDTNLIRRHYDALKNRCLLLSHEREDGLVVSGGERRRDGRMNSRGLADIVDWPECERDGFVFREVNAVVNAFHYSNLLEMRDIALALGKEADAADFAARAAKTRTAFQRVFFDERRGIYVDGEGTSHASLHANAAALAFGLAGEESVDSVADFCVSRGMAASPYFAQYLLEGLFKAGRAEAAIALMESRGERSWLGMMDFGATVTMEAWSPKVKPNLDMNHAWSTAPLNIITRHVLGVEPREPGFARVRVRPQTGRLKRVEGVVPTPRGPVRIKIEDGKVSIDAPSTMRVE